MPLSDNRLSSRQWTSALLFLDDNHNLSEGVANHLPDGHEREACQAHDERWTRSDFCRVVGNFVVAHFTEYLSDFSEQT